MLRRMRLAGIVLVSVLFVGGAAAQEKAREANKTVVYDVADLLHKPGERYPSIEAIISQIATTVNPESWKPGQGDRSKLEEWNGTRLIITTTARQHKEIGDLLATLRRLKDMLVVLECDYFEVDRKVFENEIEPNLPGTLKGTKRRLAALVEDDLARKVRKLGTDMKSSRVKAGANRSTQLFSLRRAFTFKGNLDGSLSAGTEGVVVRSLVSISPDRRFVHLKLTQKTTELLEIKQEQRVDLKSGEVGNVDAPDYEEKTATTAIEVPDGVCLLLPLSVPHADKNRASIRLLLIRPHIVIGEEEKERAREDKGS